MRVPDWDPAGPSPVRVGTASAVPRDGSAGAGRFDGAGLTPCPRMESDERTLHGYDGGGGAVGRPQLGQDVAHVLPHGAYVYAEVRRRSRWLLRPSASSSRTSRSRRVRSPPGQARRRSMIASESDAGDVAPAVGRVADRLRQRLGMGVLEQAADALRPRARRSTRAPAVAREDDDLHARSLVADRAVASAPSMTGMARSMSTTSGVRAFTSATASLPFAASPTTSRSRCPCRGGTSRPSRTIWWSSTIRTRVRCAAAMRLSCPTTRCSARSPSTR